VNLSKVYFLSDEIGRGFGFKISGCSVKAGTSMLDDYLISIGDDFGPSSLIDSAKLST
jgi:hypothetical protein